MPRLLPLLALVFVGLAGYYSLVTPIFETPDEVWHFAYIRQLALHQSLPVVDAEGKEPYRHEGLQPPLYYVIGSTLIAWMNERDLPMPTPNPYARIGEPRAQSNDNRNAFLHTEDEAFPFRGAALAVHLLRFYSVILGALTVLLTFLLAREIFPDQIVIAWGAALFVAFLPQFLFISGAISNDNLATPFAVATLWQLARIVRQGLTSRRAVIVGFLIGAGLLTKLNTIALLPLAMLVFAYATYKTRDWRTLVKSTVILAAMVAVIAGWWYLRNVLLYGDPTTFARLAVLVGERPRPMNLWRWTTAENEGLRLSMWGMFGWFNILASPQFYQFYDLLAAVGIIGIVVALATRRSLSIALAILPVWCVLIFIALWQYASIIITSQGRLLFPALAAWAVLWSWGITTLVPSRVRAWVVAGIGGLLAINAALVPTTFIAPAYTPTLITSFPSSSFPLDWRFENGIEWLGASVDRAQVRPGEELYVTIYQRVPVGQVASDAIFVHLVNSADVIVAQRDSLIGSGNLNAQPTARTIAETYTISIPIGAPAPDEWRVQIGMYDPISSKRLAPERQSKDDRAQSDSPTLATLHAQPAPAESWNFDFDGRATLLGVELDRGAVKPGGKLSVTLHWGASAANYNVFVHALGDNERTWAGTDTLLKTPTTQLELVFDPQTPPGIYQLELGVYPAPDGDRLGIYDRRGQDANDRLFLGPIRVTTP